MEEHQLAYKEMEVWLAKFEKIIGPEGLAVEIIGSFATGLWIKQCNIDLLLVRKDPYEAAGPAKEVLERIY